MKLLWRILFLLPAPLISMSWRPLALMTAFAIVVPEDPAATETPSPVLPIWTL